MTEVAAAATKSNGAALSGTAVSGVTPQPSSGNLMTSWPEYMVDAFQRSVLFLDLLRQRGNEQIEMKSRPMATVLRFGHDVLMDGRSLPRPMNYALCVSCRLQAS